MALGPLSMTPAAFWDSTLAEIEAMGRGWKWRTERARERDAWMMANLVQPHTKKRIKPEDFLRAKESTGEKRAKFDRMVAKAKATRKR